MKLNQLPFDIYQTGLLMVSKPRLFITRTSIRDNTLDLIEVTRVKIRFIKI
jgi:hypothetical protein